MAFNGMTHIDQDYAAGGSISADMWRVLWAYSDDGETWTIDPQILFRDTSEASALKPTGCVAQGLLVSDLLVDSGYFYLTMTKLNHWEVYLLRSPIDTWSQSEPGYAPSGWEIVSGTDFEGDWIWTPVDLGEQEDFESLGLGVMPNFALFGGIRQSAVARVFESTTPNSDSRYVALVAEGGSEVWLYTADSLSTGPFQRQSEVTLDTGHPIGFNGLEFGFTHYPDNGPASPRIIDDQLDLWFVTDKRWTGAVGTQYVVDRYTAAVSNLF